MTSESLYSPFPLRNNTSIRLVEIVPNADQNAPIECRLRTFDLERQVNIFHALSYVWGDANKTSPILCNGIEFQATINLVSALRRIRHVVPSNDWRTGHIVFWIDAICINQNDLTERAQQVSIMRDIYRAAATVYVDLGEDVPGLNIAMGLFNLVLEIAVRLPPERWPETVPNIALDNWGSTLPLYNNEAWNHLDRFFSRPWFSRVWVIQEAVMALRDPVVLCSFHQLPLLDIITVCSFLEKCQPRSLKNWRHNILNIKFCKEALQKVALFKILQAAQGFGATDPRDKVFALLPLSDASLELRSSPLLEVSYTKSVKDVFRDVAIAEIRHCKSRGLDILGKASGLGSSSIPGLPSWVPDWVAIEVTFLPSFNARFPDGTALYNTCREAHEALVKPVDKLDDVLRLKGLIFDEINWVMEFSSERCFSAPPQIRRPGRLQMLWNHVRESLKDRYTDQEELMSDFRATVTARNNLNFSLGAPSYLEFLLKWAQNKELDWYAEQWLASHSGSRPSDVDKIEALEVEKLTVEFEGQLVTWLEEHYALRRLFKRKSDEWNCTKDQPKSEYEQCRHCTALTCPEKLYIRPRIGGHHPGLVLRDVDPFMRDYFDILESDSRAEEFFSISMEENFITDTMLGRCFFVTKKGSLGVGPVQSSAGDKVVVFPGGMTPFVVRPAEAVEPTAHEEEGEDRDGREKISRWTLLGDSYVHGYMNGEAIPEGFNWDFEGEWFDLV